MRDSGGRVLERPFSEANRVTDEYLGLIFCHLDKPADRNSVSLVCRQWKRVDQATRKHVQIANCYSVAPSALTKRFPNLESLKIKGKPRAFEYGLLPSNWGGYAKPWVAEVAKSYAQRFQSLWLQRMHVTDADLTLLANSCSDTLLTLKLHKCSGFSARGIASITSSCRYLKVLFMESCETGSSDTGDEWLHNLAQHNFSLEELNFQYSDELVDINLVDLETIVNNCKSLRSLKVNEVDMLEVKRIVSRTSTIKELGAGSYNDTGDAVAPAQVVNFPMSVIALSGLYLLSDCAIPSISSLLPNLEKLDLQYVDLSQDGHCQILGRCINLEVLEVRHGLGDAGLVTVARTCGKLRRIRIDSEGDGFLSPLGIIPLVQNCVKLEFLVMYVSDINNATLVAVGQNCTVMKDCRFVLLSVIGVIQDLPLDEGVKSLLNGCQALTRFALYVRHGALTDKGMAYIGEFGRKLKWILLGCPGESDAGLHQLAVGCQSLERLEIRDCIFTEAGLSAAVGALSSLKFLWVQGYNAADAGGRLMAKALPCWNVEVYSGSGDGQPPGQLTAYHSLVGGRTDCPPEIQVFSNVTLPAYPNGLL